jgi:hypothetical protein
MHNLWLKEEVKAKQRSRDRDIKEGDRNTSYFHAVANQRRRKMLVHSLDGPDGPATGEKEMIDLATSYYKDLFKLEESSSCSLADDFFSADEKITLEQNASLEAPSLRRKSKKLYLTPTLMELQGQMAFLLFFIRFFGIQLNMI